MNSDLELRILRKFLLLFFVIFFSLSLVTGQELSWNVGKYILTGEDVSEGIGGELRFSDFESDGVVLEITRTSEEFVILMEGVRGTLEADGEVHGVAEIDGAYISIQADPSVDQLIRELDDGVEFTYNIPGDELTIRKGHMTVGGQGVTPDKSNEITVVGNDVFLDGQATLDDVGDVEMVGSFVPQADGVLFSGVGLIDRGDGWLSYTGDFIFANDAFSAEDYEGAYFQQRSTSLKLKSVDGTMLWYKPLVGNKILDKRQEEEAFHFFLTDGGEVTVTNREETRQTPLVDVTDDTGVKVDNGWFTQDEGYLFIEPPTIETPFDLSGAATTLPLVEHFPDDSEVIFSSTNSFVSKTSGREIMRYNDLGASITDDFSDNDVRTIEDLEKAWPQFTFKIEQTGEMVYTPSSATIGVTDQWLKDHGSTTPMKTLIFSDKMGSYGIPTTKTIAFSDALYSITKSEEELLANYGTDRELAGNPYRILTHENAHLVVGARHSLLEEYNAIVETALENIARDEQYTDINSEVYAHVRSGDTAEFLQYAGTDGLEWYAQKGNPEYLSGLYLDICFFHSEQDSTMKQCQLQIEQFAEKYGLPAGYALRNYGTKTEPQFREMPSTWIEEPILQRYYRANLGNEYQRDVYTKLAQLAYDSDQISSVECKIILIHDCEKGVLWSPR